MKLSCKNYKISIIIPVYNRKKLLKRALESVFIQSYKDYEVIVVDDGSTDNVEKFIIPLIKNNTNFKYLKHYHRGLAFSLNAGLKLAEGDFITFLDSDDEYEKHHLKKRMEFFYRHKSVDLIHSTANLIGKKEDMYVPDARNIKKLIHLNECVIGGTFFGKRKVFNELSGFRNIYSQDSDFYNRAVKKYNVRKIDIPTYVYYRNTPGSIINNMKANSEK